MSLDAQSKNSPGKILRGVLFGFGTAVVFLLIGLVLDYGITQILSQYVVPDCSEDCYFSYFNAIFVAVVVISLAGGVWGGVRAYRRAAD